MPPTPKAPAIEYVHNVSRAEHQIGVRAGGYFVPFAVLSDARYAQLVENAQNRAVAAEKEAEEEES